MFPTLIRGSARVHRQQRASAGRARRYQRRQSVSCRLQTHINALIQTNVLIDDRGAPRLSDFGLSVILAEHSQSFRQQSTTKTGTPRWMSPELFDDDQEKSKRTCKSDMWAFACLVVEVCSR